MVPGIQNETSHGDKFMCLLNHGWASNKYVLASTPVLYFDKEFESINWPWTPGTHPIVPEGIDYVVAHWSPNPANFPAEGTPTTQDTVMWHAGQARWYNNLEQSFFYNNPVRSVFPVTVGQSIYLECRSTINRTIRADGRLSVFSLVGYKIT